MIENKKIKLPSELKATFRSFIKKDEDLFYQLRIKYEISKEDINILFFGSDSFIRCEILKYFPNKVNKVILNFFCLHGSMKNIIEKIHPNYFH